MGQIYSKARRCVIWLGPAQGNSDIAMQQIPIFNEKFEQIKRLEALNKETLVDHGFPLFDDPFWMTIILLYSRAWYKRLWVLQEVFLAKELAAVCGFFKLDWEQFSKFTYHLPATRLIDDFFRDQRIITVGYRYDRVDPNFSDPPRIDIMRSIPKDMKRPIISLLDTSCERQTTEPVDKVYALLGLVDDDAKKRITVDYSTEARHKYWKVNIELGKFLLEEPGFEILQMTSSYSRPAELPSWCPNLDSRPKINRLSITFQAGILKGRKPPSHVEVSPKSSGIKAMGLEMDRVESIAPISWRALLLKHVYAKELLDFESGCLQLSQAAYGATDGVPIEHMLTLASGQLADRTAYPLEHIAKDYYNAMK
jgi:hypothetical protein